MQLHSSQIGSSFSTRTRAGRLGRRIITLGVAGLACSGVVGAPVDLGIDSQDDYTRLIDSIRATEYVREDFVVRARTPRIVASIASLTAYAQLNPLADELQLMSFVMQYDAMIQGEFAEDPDLLRSETFMRALRFARVQDPALLGTNTDTGRAAAALLGVGVPDPDNFSATQTRMVRYAQGLATSWHHNPRFAALLVHGFFGVLPDGSDRDGLATAMSVYLESQGYTPTMGMVNADARFAGVNQSMGMLPASYNEYQNVLNQPIATNPLVMNADAMGENLRALIDARVDALGTNLMSEPDLIEGQALAEDMGVIQQILDDQQAALMETSDERSLLYGTVILLGQSPLDELGDYASQYDAYNAALVQAADNMAEINVGLGVANHVLTFGIALALKEPGDAVDSFFALVGDGLAIADLAQGGSSTPSVDEQIYEQVLALRQQVEDLRMEMNERFDRIELQLGFMYDQMLVGFNALGSQIGDLQNSVSTILLQMNIVRSQLSRLESALYGLAQDVLLTDLTSAANTVLDYRDENNIDLSYAGQNPSFITGSEDFFTFATNTARTQSFAGSREAPTLNLSNAGDLLNGAPIARYLNDLAVLPPSFGQPPLAFATVPAPEPWAQAASAYAQLARENPWYFAYRYEQQIANYNSDPQNESLPELDEIIASGEQLVAIGTNARDEAFFDALIDLYKQKTQNLQNAVNDVINAQLEVDRLRTSDGIGSIDLWSPDGGSPSVDALVDAYLPTHQHSFKQVRWWYSPNDLNRDMESEPGLPMLGARIVASDNDTLAAQISSFEYLYSLDANPEYEHRALWEADVPPPLLQGGFATSPYFAIRYEVDTDPNPNSESWVIAYTRTIRSGMDLRITTGNTPSWYPISLYYTEDENSIYCSSNLITAGGNYDVGWDAMMSGMPYGSVMGLELFSNVLNDGESGAFSFLSNSGQCGEWNLSTDESYDLFRVTPWNDSVSWSSPGRDTFEGNLYEYLTRYREHVRDQVNSAFADGSSAVWAATLELDQVVALINAYVELAAPDAVRRSEIIRSALRAAPGESEIGLRSGDVVALVNTFTSNASGHDPRSPGDVDFDIHAIEQVLNARVDFLQEEINRALAEPQSLPPYVGWMLDELGSVRDRAFALATDDTYLTTGTLVTDALTGVMSNDTLQEYRPIEVDPGFGLIASNGLVVMNPDGSFEYTPIAGFSGTDSFEYRLIGTVVEGLPNPSDGRFVSDPTTMIIRVASGACNDADFNADGTLNFFDVSGFLVAYQAMDPAADLNGDGSFNFFDVSHFLVAYGDGCP
jgi:hypothetical protein